MKKSYPVTGWMNRKGAYSHKKRMIKTGTAKSNLFVSKYKFKTGPMKNPIMRTEYRVMQRPKR